MEQKDVSVCDGLPPLCAKYPWLVTEDDGTGDQIFYTIHEPLLQFRYRIPELLGKHIRGCFFDWVILSENIMWSLWNPSNSKIINLPPLTILKDDDHIGSCCLSAPPDDPSSVILLTRPKKPTFVVCRVHGKRSKLRWKEMSYVEQLKRVTGEETLVQGLTYCNGKVYALTTGNSLASMVLQVDIVVKLKEVAVKLWLLVPCPSIYTPSSSLYKNLYLKGSGSDLFCIAVAFWEETKITIANVGLFKLDMTSINWEEIQGRLKKWDARNIKLNDETEAEDLKDLCILYDKWEKVLDLKDAIFFVDLARDFSVYYRPAVSTCSGGYIHIRGEMGKIIHSYCLTDKTICLSSMPCHVLPRSHVSVWECRLEGDHIDSVPKQEKSDKDVAIVVRRTSGDEDEFTESHLLNLPFHVLELVMQASLGVEYLNFRAACKSCHLAAPLTNWRSEAALKRLQNYSLSSPWLMVVHEKFTTFTDPISGDKYVTANLDFEDEELFCRRIFCSRFGWLLCVYNCFTPMLYNHFTGDLQILPDFAYPYASMCFSAPPTSPDCMVVAFSYIRRSVFIHIVSQEQSWREVHLDIGSADDGRLSFHFPTFYGEYLYALSENGQLYLFKNVDTENFSSEQVVAGVPACTSRRAQRFLTKCDQYLLLIIVSEELVKVFKLNDSTKEWEKIYGLGRHTIYVSGASCISIEAKLPHMENKIYFPQLHSNIKGRVVFYSLETCTYGTFNQKNNIEETTFVKYSYELYPHVWIEPSWSRLLH